MTLCNFKAMLRLNLLCLLGSFMFFTPADASSPLDAPEWLVKEDSSKVIFTNWLSEREGMCVYLNKDGDIEVSINVLTQTSHVQEFPVMHYEFSFDNGPLQVSNPITSVDLMPVQLYGESIFQATFIKVIPFVENCSSPTEQIPVDYHLALVTPDTINGGYMTYPVDDYIGTLFPSFIYDGGGTHSSSIDMGQKTICCQTDPNDNHGGAGAERLANQPVNLASQLQLTPNPFGDQLAVELQFPVDTPIELQIFDSMGKRWHVQREAAQRDFRTTVNTADLPAGIYFFQVNQEPPTRLIKTH